MKTTKNVAVLLSSFPSALVSVTLLRGGIWMHLGKVSHLSTESGRPLAILFRTKLGSLHGRSSCSSTLTCHFLVLTSVPLTCNSHDILIDQQETKTRAAQNQFYSALPFCARGLYYLPSKLYSALSFCVRGLYYLPPKLDLRPLQNR